ncbi:response regulator transcription factor [Agrobacterium sp. SHOUNA12C]|uniref:Two-component response regulator protein n=2 Tax=Rhizobium rhizogenes TaxID=359 RepID=B9JLI1_RHIR8|nr:MULTISPECIES: response regulator transcription factor [Rhizobium]ACM30717.1 two-component response regulator protein [Rhizobium rhizogenes K84]KAA6488895.1 DNA-binding response regulator [Agrobacterium sp. ICMP 7243]MCJ9721052.1 response regulator transcription factor [Agrobacterium sp. BETTINA12B]MCJ9755809.1 response regulator transcription factor [Agrobacterium sp. SHOUNA12C]OCJ01500.1 DNA-binding response regulator [Agrobacterium sp. 13-626]OCJ16055.1 DNA-binding response regulator [Ag
MNRPFTAIIADDHAIVREGLKLLISAMTNVSIVAEAANGDTLLDLVRSTRADLLILDLGMPGVAGIQFISDIRALAPRMKILVLTANIEPRTVRAALDAGANGYLTKDGDPEELDTAIDAVKSGKTYLAKSIRFAVADPERLGKMPVTGEIVSPIPLTLRERQVLLLSAQGQTSRQMAERLGISPLTARKHRENLMRKLNLHSTAEVTAYAVRLGLPAG